MTDEKAVLLEHFEIVKNYIDRKDVKNIKSAEFVDDTLKFYASEDKSGEAIAEFTLPEETFLDGSKTEIVSDFSWSKTKYPKSTDPELDGKAVIVFAVKAGKTVRYSFVSLDFVVSRLTGGDTESASISVTNDVVTLSVKVSELSDNRIVLKDDGLYVGAVDSTPDLVVSTDEEVRGLFSISGAPIISANSLGARSVGDIVKINENGVPTNFIVVHKGNPDTEMYDASCDGVWLLRERGMKSEKIQGTNNADTSNDYENSYMNEWLNSTFLSQLDEKIVAKIKFVKIPYKKGMGNSEDKIQIMENGLACQSFLLSGYEVGFTVDNGPENSLIQTVMPIIGTKLDYFSDDKSRQCYENDKDCVTKWWLRTPLPKVGTFNGEKTVYLVSTKGELFVGSAYERESPRPAFIFPYDVAIDSDGLVIG